MALLHGVNYPIGVEFHGITYDNYADTVRYEHDNPTVTDEQEHRMGVTTKEALEGSLVIIADKLARLNRFPSAEEVEEDGAVICFKKQFGDGKLYAYAAVCYVERRYYELDDDSVSFSYRWSTTGPKSPKNYTWNELVEFMSNGVDEVWIVSEWIRLV